MKKLAVLIGFLLTLPTQAAVTLPYTFSAGQTIQSAQVNANLSALMNEINAHEASPNGHNTSLANVLTVNNAVGSTPINFNETQALGIRVENLSADPTPGNPGRIFYNTTTNLLKVDTGSVIISVAGTGVNNLSSVLTSGNSAGSSNLDMNENQVIHVRVENLSSDPSAGNAGRMFYNTTQSTLKVDTGSAIQAIGGAQGLASVLGVSNSVGSSAVNFNGQQANNLIMDTLSSDPGTTTAGRIYYNSTTHAPKFYNGSSWLSVGNTNTLAQTLSLGNSTGSSDLDFNGHQALNMRAQNLAAPPGTGTAGMFWYDTINNVLGYETTTSNHTVCSLDDTQTLTNKSISGSSNTLSNIPDAALSANVDLLNAAKTVSGTKTFSSAPVMSAIKTPAGTTSGHTIPNGLADDTFVLANAVQTLSGKTLNGPTLSGNQDFALYQAVRMRAENVTSTPAAGNQGRIIFKSNTGELLYDNGTSWIVLATSTNVTPTFSQVLAQSNSTGTNNIDLNGNQVLKLRVENVSGLPAAGSAGRIVFNTADTTFYTDTGAAWTVMGNPTGTANKMALYNGSGVLTAATSGDVTSSGTATTVATVGGSTAANIHTAEGLVNGSQAANLFFASPNGSSGAPSYRALVGTDLPAPSATTLGGVQSITSTAHNFLTSISTAGVPAKAQPTCADLSNGAASCSTDTTNAANISSGLLGLARGGVNANLSATGGSNQVLQQTSAGGAITVGQLAFSNLSGSAAPAQIPSSMSETNTLQNIGLSAAVASNLLTVNLKQQDGSTDPTAAAPAKVAFRSSTATSGALNLRSITAALSVGTVASGASLGTISGQNQYIYVYALDNAGTVELALAGSRVFDEGAVQSTTAIGASSTSNAVLYSTTARTGVPIRLVGRLKVNEATAGTYATAPAEVATFTSQQKKQDRSEVFVVGSGTTFSGSTNTGVWTFNSSPSVNTGAAITFTQSATLGDTFTINEDGLYFGMVTGLLGNGRSVGFTRNASGTGLQNGPDDASNSATFLCFTSYVVTSPSGAFSTSYLGFLQAGDVIRVQGNAALSTQTRNAHVRLVKVSD